MSIKLIPRQIPFFWALLLFPISLGSNPHPCLEIEKKQLTDFLDLSKGFPQEVVLSKTQNPLQLQLTIRDSLQSYIHHLIEKINTDFAAVAALDAKTGRILALFGRDNLNKKQAISPSYAVQSDFPAASLFKVVTATAALSELSVQPQTLLLLQGRYHTLYKSQVRLNPKRPFSQISLLDAFAKSINPIFGRLGQNIGAEKMTYFASLFGFNRAFDSDIRIQESSAAFAADLWELAEISSGFTQSNRISAVHAAAIAATIINQGVWNEPYLVDAILTEGVPVYFGRKNTKMVLETALTHQIQSLMRETLLSGTSRKAFRRFFDQFPTADCGGKTGSLTHAEKQVKTDWFMGYYQDTTQQKIGLAVLTANYGYHPIRSSFVARKIFEHLHQNPIID